MTLGNDDKRHCEVLPDIAENQADKQSALKSASSNHSEVHIIIANEADITRPDMLQQLIMQQKSLLIPPGILKSNINALEEYLNNIDSTHHKAVDQFDHDLSTVFTDFEKYAYKLQKHAVCKTNDIIDKAYADNCFSSKDELQHILNGSLRDGIAEVMASLYNDMAEYVQSKLNHNLQGFIDGTQGLLEKIYQQSVDLFGLQWEIKLSLPSIKNETISYSEGNEGTFTEAHMALPADNLPDSFVYPLLLKEIKLRIPVEIEKRFHDFNIYCWAYLQKTSWNIKKRMNTMVDEAENQLKSLLGQAIIELESCNTSI